jgi:hypothetical protein
MSACFFGVMLATATALPAMAVAQVPPGVNETFANLADQPATHMGFVFDRSMLQGIRGVLQSEGMTPERAAAALTSIGYDNYRYRLPAVYAPDAMARLAAAYRAAGWKHLVDAHGKKQQFAEQDGTTTDLWLHMNGMDVDGITVMTRGVKNMNVIQVACDLKPIELLHLSGHFGIPKVDPGAVMVPDPQDK